MGPEAGDFDEECFPYLDAERDATIIIQFLLNFFHVNLKNYVLTVHDRFAHEGT